LLKEIAPLAVSVWPEVTKVVPSWLYSRVKVPPPHVPEATITAGELLPSCWVSELALSDAVRRAVLMGHLA
jgi:hypothetical protein